MNKMKSKTVVGSFNSVYICSVPWSSYLDHGGGMLERGITYKIWWIFLKLFLILLPSPLLSFKNVFLTELNSSSNRRIWMRLGTKKGKRRIKCRPVNMYFTRAQEILMSRMEGFGKCLQGLWSLLACWWWDWVASYICWPTLLLPVHLIPRGSMYKIFWGAGG